MGCEEIEKIKKEDLIAIAIKPDKNLESIANQLVVLVAEELENYGCSAVMIKVISPEDMTIAETQPNLRLYKEMVNKGANKLLIGRLTREEKSIKIAELELNIIEVSSRKSIGYFSREISTISPEAFRATVYKLFRENLIKEKVE